MAQSSPATLRQRMKNIWDEALMLQFNIQDIIPQEMREYIKELLELDEAKEYIANFEGREKDLAAENKQLKKDLDAAKNAAQAIPEEMTELQSDNKGLQNKVDFYKKLKDDAEGYSERLQRRLDAALQNRTGLEQKNSKIAELEQENKELRDDVFKLNFKIQEHKSKAEAVQSEANKAAQEKQAELLQVAQDLAEKDSTARTIANEKGTIEEEYKSLLSNLGRENVECVEAVNRMSNHIRCMERLQIRAFTEAKILNRYYQGCLDIVHIYQCIFQQLFSPVEMEVTWLPNDLQKALQAADQECEQYKVIHEAFECEGLQHGDVHRELAGMAFSAERLQRSLGTIAGDVGDFLNALEKTPDLFSVLRGKLGVALKRSLWR
ncbi:hypothetical protein BCR34DRAFT_589045 [Clohesyomyces aquaticus]|uniref:Uncharacterized protein n=1 Tax=Clohesyomyces aquaticus TaxID=1231657 RepID=A0A1Y1ZHW8_9PLEO|nr:hypothetical protein BCR34DRAFT_589045 [Clohesyomyces aquaticus]